MNLNEPMENPTRNTPRSKRSASREKKGFCHKNSTHKNPPRRNAMARTITNERGKKETRMTPPRKESAKTRRIPEGVMENEKIEIQISN
jgi:hypothetical protein